MRVRFKAYEELLHKLETKDGEIGIYKIARLGEMKTWDLAPGKCIKDQDQKKKLVKEGGIK